MWNLIIFLVFVSNLNYIECVETSMVRKNLTVYTKKNHDKCVISPGNLQLLPGDVVDILAENNISNYRIDSVLLKQHVKSLENPVTVSFPINNEYTKKITNVSVRSDDTRWQFEINLIATSQSNQGYNNGTYNCEIAITKRPEEIVDPPMNFWLKIGIALLGVAIFIIVAQAIGIYYLKSKAADLHRHRNLSRKSTDNKSSSERGKLITDRYTDFGKLSKKQAPTDINRVSTGSGDIYEVPDISAGFPHPPAVPDTPRPPRGHNTLKLPPSASSTLRSDISNFPTMPRSKPSEPEASLKSIALRPPQPLPHNGVTADENRYDPPPRVDLLSRPPPNFNKPVPLKPADKFSKPADSYKPPPKFGKPTNQFAMPTEFSPPTNQFREPVVSDKADVGKLAEKFGKQFPVLPMNALKPASGLPPVLAKPNKTSATLNKPPARFNETTSNPTKPATLPKKQNQRPTPTLSGAVPVPVKEISDPGSLKKPFVKPKPPLPTPVSPAPQTTEQCGNFFQERHRHDSQSSDDEEWTYEELPRYNIYNI